MPQELEENYSPIVKVDSSLGLVMGYAIVCKDENGEDYFDLHGHHITEKAMLDASVDFMAHRRHGGDMHKKEDGKILFAWPMTTEIAKAFGLDIKKTGLMVAMKPENPETLAKFASGEYTGFSIGGFHTGPLEDVA